ncbi:TetR/AcrR family transcriptional regulator [Azohydromonas australica]|jgi:AcrR family transcriptional regulator|uniref:TetR/AcrR family transcriptional regulator n=1 Tax=Azohydromonas australica TaxID=364039 RepID=UPI000A06B141|nr:TetR/AcrR family transcriptional regulator [Azohydromonas australica]
MPITQRKQTEQTPVSQKAKPLATRATKSRAKESPAQSTAPIGRDALLDAAVHQFAKAGYDGTTMRDIATVSGMLAGSIYYYFKSKEELFIAVHEFAMEHICRRVRESVDPNADPWTRLTQAAEGYLDTMLNEYDYASIIITEFPRKRPDELHQQLIEHRHRFESMFAAIVAELPLRKGVDRTYFRLAILGMLAWSYTWYRPTGRDSPKVIAKKMVNLLKESAA